MKLAVFSPLNPQRSGISDYMEELLPYLAERAEIHLFIDDYRPSNREVLARFPVIDYRGFPEHERRHQYNLIFYQMGNNPYHRYCYPFLSKYPGVTVLHDLVLHHLIAGMTVAEGNFWGYIRELAFAYGPEGERIAREVIAGRREPPFFDYPLFDRAARSSLGVIGHSQHVVNAVRKRHPEVPAVRVPMGIPLPPLDPDPAATRERLGLPQDAFIVASLGEATPHKRLVEAMRAFAVLRRNHPDALYVIVGNRSPALDLDGLAASLNITNAVRVAGYVSRADFDAYLQAVDVCLNLRYPTAGETSASALRCMAAARPVLVSDVGANRELPDAVCLKVPVGAGEQEAIVAALEQLRDAPEARRALGWRAREFIATQHTLAGAADAYLRFATQIMTGAAASETWQPSESVTAQSLLQDVAAELVSLGIDRGDTPLLRQVADAMYDVGVQDED